MHDVAVLVKPTRPWAFPAKYTELEEQRKKKRDVSLMRTASMVAC
jgi:hypothetical protein